MVCNKCGAQCEDNQAFCLMCGNPIQLTADFNLIEKELASSIDELMSEIETETTDISEEEDNELLKTVDVPIEEINMGLKMVDIKRTNVEEPLDLLDDEEDEISPVYIPSERAERVKTEKDENNRSKATKKPVKKSSKNSNKKIYAIVGIVAVVVLAIAVALILFFSGDDTTKDTKKSFNDYYTEADGYYKDGNMDKALESALEAVQAGKADADKIKARKLVHSIYTSQNYTGEFYLNNIEELIALGDTSEDYYGVIFNKYITAQNTEMLRELINTVGEDKAKEYLGESYVDAPVTTIESGQYNNYMSFELKAAEGCKIYYSVNDDINKNAQEYIKAIDIMGLGEYKVQAYAVSEAGIPSMTVEYSYSIVEGELTAPVVTPNPGTYQEHTQITIVIPEGGKAYYTYDGTTPSTSSTEYTEPVDMLKGSNTFSAIVVDKYGNTSEVTSVYYNLKLPRNETLTSAKNKIWNHFVETGKSDLAGNMADGSVISLTYENAVELGNDEYYIYSAVTTSADGTTTAAITYVGVNSFDGTVVEGIIEANGEYILPEIDEDNADNADNADTQ